MSQFRYRPAGASGWLAVASELQLLVVHPQAADAGVAVYSLVQAGDPAQGFQAAVDELTKGGFSATPPFALLEWSGTGDQSAVRVIVRGGVQVAVSAGGSTHTLDGTGVSTWTERSFPQVTAVEVVVVPAADDEAADERWLPLSRGTALVTRIASAVSDSTPNESKLSDSKSSESKASNAASGKATAAAGRATAQRAAAPKQKADVPATEPIAVPQPAVSSQSTAIAAGEAMSEVTMVDVPTELHSDARPTDDGYDYLFGETMYRNVSEAAMREPDPEAEAEAEAEPKSAPEVPAGDHDGMTIMTGDLKKLRGNRKSRAADAPPKAPAPSPDLYLELSTGSREPLSQSVVVGRAPKASKVSGGALPRLVTIPGDKDISRNHAQFAVEGGTVVVTDLHSRNGTQVIMPGKSPQQLRQGEPTAVIVGTVVDLGGGVTLTVREEG